MAESTEFGGMRAGADGRCDAVTRGGGTLSNVESSRGRCVTIGTSLGANATVLSVTEALAVERYARQSKRKALDQKEDDANRRQSQRHHVSTTHGESENTTKSLGGQTSDICPEQILVRPLGHSTIPNWCDCRGEIGLVSLAPKFLLS